MGDFSSWDSSIKYAYDLFQKAIDMEGKCRQDRLNQAKNVLDSIPDEHPNKKDLMRKITNMLY